MLDEFTGNQRFFPGVGQLWRNLTADDEFRLLTLTNRHRPGEFHTNGVSCATSTLSTTHSA